MKSWFIKVNLFPPLLEAVYNKTFSNFKSSHGNATYAPGDSTSSVTYTNSTTNYGMLMDQTLGRKLKSGYGDSSTGSQLVSDGSSSTDEKYFFYKYLT